MIDKHCDVVRSLTANSGVVNCLGIAHCEENTNIYDTHMAMYSVRNHLMFLLFSVFIHFILFGELSKKW